MFRGEHGAGIEGADEMVCEMGGTWVGLMSPQRKSVTMSKEG